MRITVGADAWLERKRRLDVDTAATSLILNYGGALSDAELVEHLRSTPDGDEYGRIRHRAADLLESGAWRLSP